jgi:hypothetical protein
MCAPCCPGSRQTFAKSARGALVDGLNGRTKVWSPQLSEGKFCVPTARTLENAPGGEGGR